jgi:hypothetical protein
VPSDAVNQWLINFCELVPSRIVRFITKLFDERRSGFWAVQFRSSTIYTRVDADCHATRPINPLNFGLFGEADSWKALFFAHDNSKKSIFLFIRVAPDLCAVTRRMACLRRT